VSRPSDGLLKPADASASGESYILHCQYCDWTSLDIGVRFSKPTKITEQLNRLWKERTLPTKPKEDEILEEENESKKLNHECAFANLSSFYKDQLQESGDQQNLFSNSPYSSPANLARIMSLYGGLSYNALKKTQEKPQPMREASKLTEGLCTYSADDVPGEDEVLQRLRFLGLDGTSSLSQRLAGPTNYDAKFLDQLWPVATKLRVRRGKRCRTCRQFLARPEPKVGSMRYKIRLLAVNHIQRLSMRTISSLGPVQSAAFHLRAEPLPEVRLQPNQLQQYILTVRNPIFETVRVTLATPSTTPGRVASRVTILCPSFTVGPAGDVWDEALSTSSLHAADGGRQAAMASLTGSTDTDRQPEAGKIWERSRSSTSVILEVIPGSLRPQNSNASRAEDPSAEDEDVLEIPIYVRAEWEADLHDADTAPANDKKRERESKELAYWCVIGVGRIAGS